MIVKIAIPTDDGATISGHFGQAKQFKIFTIENKQILSTEMREKASHQHGDHSHAEGVHPGQLMVAVISDCQVLISGGMGTGAFNKAQAAGLEVTLTAVRSIDEAVAAYPTGGLKSDSGLIHMR
jgi:predicted Fe-Mo cluster-binding NifX family protein